MYPDTEIRFVSEEVGVGVFATKLIPKETIVWIKVLESTKMRALQQIIQRFYINILRTQSGTAV